MAGSRDRIFGGGLPQPLPALVSRNADAARSATERVGSLTRLRSQPWWQEVVVLRGDGPARHPVDIATAAIQWRVTPTCGSGRMVVRSAGRSKPIVSTTCPPESSDVGYATEPGGQVLAVQAGGAWQLRVEQQVDVPLEEDPLPEMASPNSRAVARGSFYRIDQQGQGVVTLHRLADGSAALRLADFFVTANVDLEVRLSPLAAPRSTDEFVAAPSVSVADLDVTAGSLNFRVPAGVDLSAYRSVVIWCEQLHTAYAAASLEAFGQ